MTGKRFTSMYNEQSDMIQYVDTLKEEPNKWSICNVSETLKKLNELDEDFDDALNTISRIQEENQALQEEIKDYNDALARLEEKQQRERTSSTKQHLKWSKEAEKQIQQLKDIIDQLRTDNTQQKKLLNKTMKQNHHIKTTIKTMMENERTELGRSVLKQLWEAIQ